jgi:hypothetical protein
VPALRPTDGAARPSAGPPLEARSILGLPAVRTSFLDDLHLPHTGKGQTGRRISIRPILGTFMSSLRLVSAPHLQDDDDDLLDDEEDFEREEQEELEDEDADEDEDEEEEDGTWYVDPDERPALDLT